MADIVIDRSDAQIKAGIEKASDLQSSASEIDGTNQSANADKITNLEILSIHDLRTFSEDGFYKSITLPNPYPSEDNAPVHPSIVKCDTIFKGYKYWIAYTPYPNTNSDFENPCVVATNDFKTFAEPSSNPLVEKPAVGYNADTHLVLNEDCTRLYLLYRQRGGGQNSLNVMHTDDGITWTSPVLLFTSAASDFASPSAWFNGTNWVFIYHDLDSVATPKPMYRVQSDTADIYGSYSVPVSISIPPSPKETIQYWWHSCFERVSDTQIIGLVQESVGGGGTGNLYLVQSFDDGLTFEICDREVTNKGGYYRSTFFRDLDSLFILPCTLTGELTVFKSITGFEKDNNNLNNRIDNYLMNASYDFSDVLFLDSFNRADSGSLGVSDSGQIMSTTGSGYEIRDNKAFPLSDGAKALIDVTASKYTVHTKVNMTNGEQQWIIVKQVDSANFIRIGVNSGTIDNRGQTVILQEIINGGVANAYVSGARIVSGDAVSIECKELILKILFNNEVVYSYKIPNLFIQGSTVGMQSNVGATTSFDYFIVTR